MTWIGADDPGFLELVRLLDVDLNGRYGSLQAQYDTHNRVECLDRVALVCEGDRPVACGGYKVLDAQTVELKRLFVRPECRGKGHAKRLVESLLEEAHRQGHRRALLETGLRQTEAIALYERLGFARIENYGPYAGNANSVCMARALDRKPEPLPST